VSRAEQTNESQGHGQRVPNREFPHISFLIRM
jgi:hypothetical protein